MLWICRFFADKDRLWTWLTFVTLLCLFLFFLGLRPLATPDEGRYAEIPREMLASGDWVVPHLGGLPYFEKPPLVYWMTAGAIKLGGMSPFVVRLPLALFAWLGCLILYGFARPLVGTSAARLAAFILGTSSLYFFLARFLILDLFLTVWFSAGLFCFYTACFRPPGWHRLIMIAGYGLCMAGAVMTKGLVAGFAAVIIALWIGWTRQWCFFWIALHPLAATIFFLLAAPWHVLAGGCYQDFWWFYFVHEHFLRYSTDAHNRVFPFWFFVPVLIAGFFPWISWLPGLLRKEVQPSSSPTTLHSFLWIWAGSLFIFFSLSGSKLVPYILPIFPPLALLTASAIAQVLQKDTELSSGIVTGYVGLCWFLSVGLFVARAFRWIQTTHGLNVEYQLTLSIAGLSLLFATLGLLGWIFRDRARLFFRVQVLGQLIFLVALVFIDPWVQRLRSIEDVAEFLKLKGSTSEIIAYEFYPQDLAPYLGQTVRVLSYTGELRFGKSLVLGQDRLIEESQLATLWATKPCYVVMLERDRRLFQSVCEKRGHAVFVVYDRSPYVVCSNRCSL